MDRNSCFAAGFNKDFSAPLRLCAKTACFFCPFLSQHPRAVLPQRRRDAENFLKTLTKKTKWTDSSTELHGEDLGYSKSINENALRLTFGLRRRESEGCLKPGRPRPAQIQWPQNICKTLPPCPSADSVRGMDFFSQRARSFTGGSWLFEGNQTRLPSASLSACARPPLRIGFACH